MAILDIKNTTFAVNSKGRNSGIRIKDGNHIFIEIKASRTNRSFISSKNKWYKLILSDIEKLNKYSNKCYMLCFDYNCILDDKEISSLKEQANKNIDLYYIKTNKSVSYIDVSKS